MVTLFRMVEPCAGSLTIDGVDGLRVGLQDLRKAISIIPQVPALWFLLLFLLLLVLLMLLLFLPLLLLWLFSFFVLAAVYIYFFVVCYCVVILLLPSVAVLPID